MDTTPVYAIPFPEDPDPPDGPDQMEAMALRMEALLASLTAQVASELAARAKGVVKTANVGTSSDADTTGIITDSLTFTAEAGRSYRVSVLTPVLDNQANVAQTAITVIRWAAGASVTVGGTAIAKDVTNTPATNVSATAGSAAETAQLVTHFAPGAGQVTVGIHLAASSAASAIRFLASGTTGPDLTGKFIIEDIGLTAA